MIKHVITGISYSRDWLQCICGWEGKARDLRDYATHKKEAPPLEDDHLSFDPLYAGRFVRTKTPTHKEKARSG